MLLLKESFWGLVPQALFVFFMLNELEDIFSTALDPGEGLGSLDMFSQIGIIIANIVIGLSFSISLITLAYAGILFMTTMGDPKSVDKARNAFVYSLIAGLISIMTLVIKAAVLHAAGVRSPDIVDVPNF